jgi:hypothetical protein
MDEHPEENQPDQQEYPSKEQPDTETEYGTECYIEYNKDCKNNQTDKTN